MPVGHCWSFRASPWKSVGTMFVRPSGDFGVRSPKGLLPLCGSKIHLRFPVAREFYGWLIIATSTSGDARRVTTFERKRRQAARRVVSTAPPARGQSDFGALPLAGAASPLTCRAAPVNSSSFAALITPEGLRSLRSASSLPFLVTCQRQVIPSHSFAALTALVVRRVSGDADRPMLSVLAARTPPAGALAGALGSGTLPPHPAAAPCRARDQSKVRLSPAGKACRNAPRRRVPALRGDPGGRFRSAVLPAAAKIFRRGPPGRIP